MLKFLKSKTAKTVGGLMVGFMMLTAGVNLASAALTTTQVDAILALLNSFGADAATVANVQASLTGGTPVVTTPSTSTYDFGTATLRVGSKGTYVKNLQSFLGITSDGAFGPMTKKAVMDWQSANGLTADGIFGPMSKAKANMGGTTPDPVIPAGPVSVSLATDNPASGSFIAPASGVTFAKYTFTGTGTVTSVKLTRTGVSASTTLGSVYLYDGSTRLTDGSSIGTDNTVTFNSLTGLFTVAGSKTISVVADTLVADYSIALDLSSITANGTTTAVNVMGNKMFGASATLASVAMSSATGSGATDPGADISVWQGTATVSTRDVLLKTLALRQIGSISSSDITNFKLYVDGVLVSTVSTLDSNGYVTFAGSYALKTGARTLKVTADIMGGSGRTVQMSLRGAYDLITTDTQYNANGTTTGTFPFGPSSFTVNNGSLTVVKKTDSQSANVTLGASDQSLASYTFTAYGEAIKVETLKVGMITTGGTVTDNTLRNVRILVDGSQVGSNTSVPAAASFAANTGTSFTTNFMVYPGTPVTVEIRSDIYDNEGTDDIAAGTTTAIQALLVGGTGIANGVPQVSLGTINVPTSANVVGNNLTISSGSMSLAKTSSYADQTIAVPVTAYKIGSFQLSGNSTEAVNLNTIYVGFADTTSDAAPATDLSDLYVVYGSKTTTVKGSVTCTYSSGCVNANSWTISETLGVNETMQMDVYASIASSLSTNSLIPTLAVAGITANSGITYYADASGSTSLSAGVSGQEITGGTGSITATTDASTPVAQLVDDSGTIKTQTLKFAALTDSYTVTDMTFTLGNASAVSTVTLKDHTSGAVVGASKPGATSLTWSGLSMAVPANTSKLVDVELALTSVGVGAGTSDASLLTTLTAFTARNSAGTSAAGTESNPAGNAMYIYKAVPLVSSVALPSGSLIGGTQVLAKFTVSSNGTGTIAWKQVMLEVAKSAAPILGTPTLWNSDTGAQVTAAVVFQNDTNSDAACNASDTACEILISVGTDADDNTVETISGARTYEIRSAITGTLASGNVISTVLDRNLSYVASGAFTSNENDNTANDASFVWSDESNSATSDTGVSVWKNEYQVKNLPVNWTLTRS